ncbi:MAG: transposase [Syntrophomonadaceae bacterium]|nr:transposase [Syntrophomonadaceae bacterium]
MAAIRLRPGVRYRTRDGLFEINRAWMGGNYEVTNLNTGMTGSVTQEIINQELFTGQLRFEVIGKNTVNDGLSTVNTQYEWSDFNLIPDKYREEARFRFDIVQAINDIPSDVRTKKMVADNTQKSVLNYNQYQQTYRKVPSLTQVYEWLRSFNDSGGDIRALIPEHYKKGAKGRPRLDAEVNEIIDGSINKVYLSTNRPTRQAVYEDVLNSIADSNKYRLPQEKLAAPSYGTICFRIKQLDPYTAVAARYGDKKAGEIFGNSQEGPRPTRPLERVEIDSTPLDLLVVDLEDRLPIGKPTVTAAIDKYSGYLVGVYVGFEPPSYTTVMQCLYSAIRPKDYVARLYPEIENTWDAYGLMETLVTDNGKEFVGRDLEMACLQLGISLVQCPIMKPWYKGSIERYFRTMCMQLVHNLPGTTFSNIFEKGEYDPVNTAVISLDQFMRILHIWIIDYYSQNNHRGVKGIPSKLWEEGIKKNPPGLPPNKDELLVLLGRSEYRVIGRKGIEFEGLFYNEKISLPRLRSAAKNRNEKFLIKYDPSDISRVFLYDHLISNKYIEVPAMDQKYSQGMSIWKHRIIRKLARTEAKEVDIYALAGAKAKIQAIVDQEWKLTKKTRTRGKMGRYIGIAATPWKEDVQHVGEALTISEYRNDILPNTAQAYAGISDFDNAVSSLQGVNTIIPDNQPHYLKEEFIDEEYTINSVKEKWDISGWNVNYSLKGEN